MIGDRFQQGRCGSIGVGPTVLVVAMLALSGCSGPPSEEEITRALQQEVDKVNTQSGGLFTVKLIEAKRLGCESTNQSAAWLCDVKTTVDGPFGDRKVSTERMRLVEAGEGWLVTER